MGKIIDFTKVKDKISKNDKNNSAITSHSVLSDWYRFQELSEERKKEVNAEVEKLYREGYLGEDKWYKNVKSEYEDKENKE